MLDLWSSPVMCPNRKSTHHKWRWSAIIENCLNSSLRHSLDKACVLPLYHKHCHSIYCLNFSLPTSSLLGTKVLRRPIHSLEINTVKNFDFAGRTFLVTGSEDTKIKIFDAGAPTFRRFRTVATLTTHISSVKCVDVVVGDDFALIVSAGGRAQVSWTVFPIATFPINSPKMRRPFQTVWA